MEKTWGNRRSCPTKMQVFPYKIAEKLEFVAFSSKSLAIVTGAE
jgi:hypothetical protein